ncbi:ATP-binding cassette domain-containing protein, partial [Escherichia coli]|uniref:ATP-binding cassette domain-containing protein n=1 Tax=Escherichia coli TaxID=562 RepID=UPI0013D38E12
VVAGYGSITILNGTSFAVKQGTITTVIGPNGAGKSTTVGMICGLTAPDAGEVSLAGGIRLATDAAGYKRRIGLVPQDIALYE